MNISITRLGLLPLFLAAGSAFANITSGVDPSYVRVKVVEVRISPNTDCSNGITVFRNDAAGYQDMVNNPTLGAGAIPNGTYQCVMLHMSDYIHYTPATATGTHNVCTVGSDFVSDVGHDGTAVDPDGTTHVLGSAGTESMVWLYIRPDAPTAGNINSFAPTGGIPLLSPLVVNGDGAHTMVFDFSGRIGEEFDNGVWDCGCDAPTLSFR